MAGIVCSVLGEVVKCGVGFQTSITIALTPRLYHSTNSTNHLFISYSPFTLVVTSFANDTLSPPDFAAHDRLPDGPAAIGATTEQAACCGVASCG